MSAQKGNIFIPLLTIVALIATLTADYFFWQNQLPSAPTLAPQDETVNWKTYLNSDYSIEFKYPTNIFVYQGNPQPQAQYWSNKKEGGAPLELGPNGLWLNLSFSNQGGNMTPFYKQIINLKPGDSISQSAVTKISDLNTNRVEGAVYFQGVPPNFAGEGAYTYEALWLHNNLVYRLSFSAFSKENLDANKKVFDQILSTFKFTE